MRGYPQVAWCITSMGFRYMAPRDSLVFASDLASYDDTTSSNQIIFLSFDLNFVSDSKLSLAVLFVTSRDLPSFCLIVVGFLLFSYRKLRKNFPF